MKIREIAILTLLCVSIVACDNDSQKSNDDASKQKNETEVSTPDAADSSVDQLNDASSASEDITDEELLQMAEFSKQFQQIGLSSQQLMMDAVKETGLEVQRYTQIQQMSQNPNGTSDATEKEMKQFNEANKKLDEIQQGLQEKMVKILEDNGVSEQWYENITAALKTDTILLQHYRVLMQEQMPAQNQEPNNSPTN